MKRLIMLGLLAISFHISQVLADSATELQMRLNKINSFHASFTQKATSIDGDLIQQGEGQLWIKRPNLFNWHLVSPDESCLVSDGINLWFYNPFIEQVIVTLLSQATTDTPFMLIIRNDLQDWKRYQISQNGNNFLLKTTQNKRNLKHFSITIQPDGTIQEFAAVEQDGHMSSYQLKGQQNSHLDDNKFKFNPPEGLTIDDQRSMK
ncbi:MAG: outer membrane lipoprotein chaperone LolA [Arsenophonus sp. NEOnobi-MAG3]